MPMAPSRPLLGFGLTLGIRLFLMLVVIIAPVLTTYYVVTFRAFDGLHQQEVEALLNGSRDHVRNLLKVFPNLGEADRDAVATELRRIVEQPESVENILVFVPSPVRGLETLAAAGPTAP